jgi:hypothetical protein
MIPLEHSHLEFLLHTHQAVVERSLYAMTIRPQILHPLWADILSLASAQSTMHLGLHIMGVE